MTGDRVAQYQLGLAYKEGKIEKNQRTRALDWFEKAANLGHVQAMYQLVKAAQRAQDYAKAAQWYGKAARAGEPLSQYEMAVMYSSSGWGQEKSPEAELEWLKKCLVYIPKESVKSDVSYMATITLAQASSALRLGKILASGFIDRTDSPLTPAEYYHRALELYPAFDEARVELAQLYVQGSSGVPKNMDRALVILLKANETHAEAQCLLGRLYRSSGKNKEAIDCFNRVATSAEGQYNLAIMCEQGLGTARDMENSLSLLKQAAEQGYLPAIEHLRPLVETHAGVQCIFGKLTRLGIGVPKNEHEAIVLYLKSYKGRCFEAVSKLLEMAKSFPEAHYYLGSMYKESTPASLPKQLRNTLTLEANALAHYKTASQEGSVLAIQALEEWGVTNADAGRILFQLFAVGFPKVPLDLERAQLWALRVTALCGHNAKKLIS